MTISIIIPVLNEENTIDKIIQAIEAVDLGSYRKEIVIIDDGSSDSTPNKLKKISQENKDVKVVTHKRNSGKGMAIRTGLANISGDIVIIQDADLEYDPQDYKVLIKPIIEDKAKVVYGSRLLKNNKRGILRYYLGGRLVTFFTNLLYNSKITDEPTCYKVFKADIFKKIKLTCKGFEFCPEITAKVLKLGYKIYEVPISYFPRSQKQGKKINWRDGVKAIYYLFKYRF